MHSTYNITDDAGASRTLYNIHCTLQNTTHLICSGSQWQVMQIPQQHYLHYCSTAPHSWKLAEQLWWCFLRCKPAWTLRCDGVEKQAEQSQEPGVSIFIWKSKQRRWQLIGRWELLVIYHVLLPNRRRKTQKLVSNWRNVATSEFRWPGTMVSCVSKEHMCSPDDEPTVGFMFHFSSSLRQSYDRS